MNMPRSRGPVGIRLIYRSSRWLLLLGLVSLACNTFNFVNSPADETSESAAETLEISEAGEGAASLDDFVQELSEETGMSLEEALTMPVEDHRGRMLELMGPPDTFRLIFQELEGTVVRREEWAYYDLGARFDFVDGGLIWSVDLESVPEVAVYAHFYDPRDFTAYMSTAEAREVLEGQELAEMGLSDGDIPEGYFIGADQLMLGFDQDRLVYAESFYLVPEVPQ
jgi:hypothetical protein